MIVARFISLRAPYVRGGLVFDSLCKRLADGRAVIEADLALIERLGEDALRELIQDPAITYKAVSADDEPAEAPPPVDPLSTDKPPEQTGVDGDAGAASAAPAELDAPDTGEAQNAPATRGKASKAPADPPADGAPDPPAEPQT